MIEALGIILPIIIYILLIILLVVVIVLGIKFIITVDKINTIITDVQNKVESLNSIFKFVGFASDKLNYLSTKFIDSIISVINKVLGVGNGKEEEDDYE